MAEISRRKVLEDFHENVKSILEKLKIDHCVKAAVPPESYHKDEFWKHIVESSKHISHEATKLSMMFSKPPLPDAATIKPICRAMEMASLGLISTLFKLSDAQGAVLRHRLRAEVLAVFHALSTLMTDLLDYEEKGEGELKVTGIVWEKCEKLENAPQDNKAATLQSIASFDSLIQDAQRELDEAIKKNLNKAPDDDVGTDENGDDDDEEQTRWEGKDLEIAQASLGLIKAAQTTAKKTYEIISSKARTDQDQLELDDIATFVKCSSECVDDLVASLYQPLAKLEVAYKAGRVALNSQAVIGTIGFSHFYTNEDETWTNFLRGAINHNFEKIELLTGRNEGKVIEPGCRTYY